MRYWIDSYWRLVGGRWGRISFTFSLSVLFWRYQLVESTLSRHPDESTKTVIQPGGKCKAKESNGLEVPPAATFRTWV